MASKSAAFSWRDDLQNPASPLCNWKDKKYSRLHPSRHKKAGPTGKWHRKSFLFRVKILKYRMHDCAAKTMDKVEDGGMKLVLCNNIQPRAAILKSINDCSKSRTLMKGKLIHGKLLEQGLLENDTYLSTALISMYANCGELQKAQEVFDQIPRRDTVSWNALLAGYAQAGLGRKAVYYFEKMKSECFIPDAITFTCVLKACGSAGLLEKGEEIHVELTKKGLLEENVVVGNATVDMYTKCGALVQAQVVFDHLPIRNVVSWNTLISGYCNHGLATNALDCFQLMRNDNVLPNEVTFVCIIKACATIESLENGEKIHEEIMKQRFFKKCGKIGNSLVDMYFRCGSVLKAQKVFDELPVHDATSWNVLIAGYTRQGLPECALKSLGLMRDDGISPDAITFASILKACGSLGSIEKGKQHHTEIIKQGLLKNNVVLGTALVDMYVKGGLFDEAKYVFNDLGMRNVVSWNSLIAGYVLHGRYDAALHSFMLMQDEGISPDKITVVSALKACGCLGSLEKGEMIHAGITKQVLLKRYPELGTALIEMYANCGIVSKAQDVFNDMPLHDVICWNTLISGYVDNELGAESLECFLRMKDEGASPDYITFSYILKACGVIGLIKNGEELHNELCEHGLLNKHIMLGNALMDMYFKCGAPSRAQEVFNKLTNRDVTSWNTLITGYVYHESGQEALDSFRKMRNEGIFPDVVTFTCTLKACCMIQSIEITEEIHNELETDKLLTHNIFLKNALVDAYVKCGAIKKAEEVFEEIKVRNIISWNVLIAGYIQNGCNDKALISCVSMQDDGILPDVVTFGSILKVCGILLLIKKGSDIHNEAIKRGLLEKSVVLGNGLVDMYSKCGAFLEAQKVFDNLLVRNVVSWNSLIAAYDYHACGHDSLICFKQLIEEGLCPDAVTFACSLKACGNTGSLKQGEYIHAMVAKTGVLSKDVMVGSALIDMYAKHGALKKAREILDELKERNVVSWNALITGVVQQGYSVEALDCYRQMQNEGLLPDMVTFASILKACGEIGSIRTGEDIHAQITKKGLLQKDIVLSIALVDMYANCAMLPEAQKVFDYIPSRNVACWNALIGGYAQIGHTEKVFNSFTKMIEDGIAPDAVTFVCLLTACSHAGLMKEGKIYLDTMNYVYCIDSTLKHYRCMVDLLSRAGQIKESLVLIHNKEPIQERVLLLLAALGACQKWVNVELGRFIFHYLLQLDGNCAAAYLCMNNIYAAADM